MRANLLVCNTPQGVQAGEVIQAITAEFGTAIAATHGWRRPISASTRAASAFGYASCFVSDDLPLAKEVAL